MKKVAWFVFFVIMGVSCVNEPDCFRQNINLVGISFKKLLGGQADTVVFTSITVNDFEGQVPAPGPTNLVLPLNYLTEQTSFTLNTIDINGEKRTYYLILGHASKTQFVSEDCGQRFIVSNLELLGDKGSFDSVRVLSTSPSNPANVNIEVYRCPRNNVMRVGFKQLYMNDDHAGKTATQNIDSVSVAFPVSTNTFYKDISTNSLLLPLDMEDSKATFGFYFENDNKQKRDVSIKYIVGAEDAANEVVFKYCGPQETVSDIEIESNTLSDLDTATVVNNLITDPPFTNIIIYRCPTTNTIKFTYKKTIEGSTVSNPVKIKSITADFLTDPVYGDTTTLASVILPLNPDAGETTYTFSYKDGTINKLHLGYAATKTTFHAVCKEQTVFTNITVLDDSDFAPKPIVKDPSAKFPTIENIEFIQTP